MGYRSDLRFEDRSPRHNFVQRGNVVRLDRFPANESHVRHLVFLGSGAALRRRRAEIIAASLELQDAAPKLAAEESAPVTPPHQNRRRGFRSKGRKLRCDGSSPTLFLGAFALALLSQSPGPNLAYEGATTLAGLTEQAALKSRLHRRMLERFALSLGLFEPLRLDPALIGEDKARSLLIRLLALDAGQGYARIRYRAKAGQSFAPCDYMCLAGWLPARYWSSRGAARCSFADSKTGGGLSRPAGMTAGAARTETVSQGCHRYVEAPRRRWRWNGTGQSAMDWIESPENRRGWPRSLMRMGVRWWRKQRKALGKGARRSAAGSGRDAVVIDKLAIGMSIAICRRCLRVIIRITSPSTVWSGWDSRTRCKLDVPSPQRLRDLIFDGKGNGLGEPGGFVVGNDLLVSASSGDQAGWAGWLSFGAAAALALWGQPHAFRTM